MASGSNLVIYAALAGNGLIAVTKFVAAALTGSSAMLSEGIHSTVDTGNQMLLLLGLRRAKQPPDERFPFGHGKEVYFYSFVVAILIFGVGAGVSLYEGIARLAEPHPVENPMVNYLVLGLSILFEGGAWFLAYREFVRRYGRKGMLRSVSRSKNPVLFVVLFEDTAAMLGLLTALAGVALAQYTGNPSWDGVAAIAIGLILAATAAWLAWETHGLLIGERTHPEIEAKVRGMILAEPEIIAINELASLHMGPDYVLLTVSVDFTPGVPSCDVEATTERLDREIKTAFPRIKRIFIETQAASRACPA